MGPTNVAVAVAVLAAGWVGCAGAAGADPPAPPPGPKTVMDHDGTYVVGTDIAPGTYSSAGPVKNGTCYWKRISDLDHNDIIDNAMSKKPQVVQIGPSDKAFKTDGCQPWQPTDTANAAATAPLPPLPAQIQLNAILGTLNANAGQAGAGQIPGP